MNKKALITGITGMVGSHLADFLLANTDWDVFGMCRWRSPLDNVAHLLDRANKKDRLFFIDGDLCDLISLQNAVNEAKPDYVFHLAAQSYPKTSFTSPIHTLDTNILGTLRLLEALRECQDIDPVIHVCSSSEVFGRVPKERLPINEDCPFHPASPYAISKIGADLVGRFHAEAYGQKVVITRMFTHSGPRRGDVFAESTFAKQIAMIEQGLIPPVVKTGNLESGQKPHKYYRNNVGCSLTLLESMIKYRIHRIVFSSFHRPAQPMANPRRSRYRRITFNPPSILTDKAS